MLPRYEIVEARLEHLRALIPLLRDGDRAEVEVTSIPARHLLFGLWRSSLVRRAALVDGEVAAVWGMSGSLAASEASVYLLTGRAIERIPLAFYREARRELRAMLETRRSLVCDVLADYTRAVRFFEMLGFEIDGPRDVGGAMFRRMRLVRGGGHRL